MRAEVYALSLLAWAQGHIDLRTRLQLILGTRLRYYIWAHLILLARNTSQTNADPFSTRVLAEERGIDLEAFVLHAMRIAWVAEHRVLSVVEMQVASISRLITFVVLDLTVLKTDGSVLTMRSWLVQRLTSSEAGCLIRERCLGTRTTLHMLVTQTVHILLAHRGDLARVSEEIDADIIIMLASHCYFESFRFLGKKEVACALLVRANHTIQVARGFWLIWIFFDCVPSFIVASWSTGIMAAGRIMRRLGRAVRLFALGEAGSFAEMRWRHDMTVLVVCFGETDADLRFRIDNFE
jgi:hypothetical protein